MNLKISTITIIMLLLLGCSETSTSDPEYFGSNFSLSSCVQHAGDGAALENLLENQMNINELAPEMAKHFLGRSKGNAWSLTSPDGSYSVTYTDDDVCTVFIKETNVTKYIKHMNNNIERVGNKSGWKFSSDSIPLFAGEKELKSYNFSANIPGKHVGITISAANTVNGNYQIAFSTKLL